MWVVTLNKTEGEERSPTTPLLFSAPPLWCHTISMGCGQVVLQLRWVVLSEGKESGNPLLCPWRRALVAFQVGEKTREDGSDRDEVELPF